MFFRRFLGLVVVSLKRVTGGIKYDFCRCDGAEQVGFARNTIDAEQSMNLILLPFARAILVLPSFLGEITTFSSSNF